MASSKLKRQFLLSLSMLVLSASLFVFSTVAWITHMFEEDVTVQMGAVDVGIDVFFYDPINGTTPAGEVILEDFDNIDPLDDITKPGVYQINITETDSLNAFEDFRVHVDVYSSVTTYFRVRIIEQLTMIYYDHNDIATELSIVNTTYMPFEFEETNWFDNRINDGFIYYQLPVERASLGVPTVLNLIATVPTEFSTYPPGYSLQIAFSIEAVQAVGGPENVWNLVTPPWGSSW